MEIKKYCSICGEYYENKNNHNKTKNHKYWKKLDDLFINNKDIIQFISKKNIYSNINIIEYDSQTSHNKEGD